MSQSGKGAPGVAAGKRWKLNRTVVLVGMMGAGKTAVGRALAARLDVPFRDSDVEIEKAANMTIAEIFQRDGEEFFRARESEVIDRLLDADPAILSVGGGAFLAARNRETIARKGLSVWLDADLDLLWSRVKHKNTRPLLRTAHPRETLRDLCEARVPLYALADVRVEAHRDYSIDDMAARVEAALAAHGDVLEEMT
ncbi:shikimate kinase [Roseovarius ramblicola]|uniref:Shikimate kinase n=1 Tax=Roseovarius ramblicola TaxID=2022336 RepID=A0ABV5I3C7_9RHOB